MPALPRLLGLLLQELPPASAVPQPAQAGEGSASAAQGAAPGSQPPPPGGLPWLQPIFLFGLLFLFMWFLIIRPERKRQKERARMLGALQKGDQVATTGGIIGQVVRLEDHTVTLKVDDNVRLVFERNAVARVLSPGKEERETGKAAPAPR